MARKFASAEKDSPSPIWAEKPAELRGSLSRGSDGDSAFYRHFRASFEGVVLLVALVAIERLFLGRGAYAGLELHPFWLPVLLVTVQHGLYGGVITACAAAAMLDWPIREPGLDIADYYLDLVRLPVQWVLVALAIGVFRQGQIQAEQTRVRDIARLRAVNDRFAEEVYRLDDELWRFEISAAIGTERPSEPGEPGIADVTVAETLARLAALRAARPADLDDHFTACAEAVLGRVGVRLFRKTSDGSFVDISREAPLDGLGATLGPEHPLVRAAIAGKSLPFDCPPGPHFVFLPLRPTPAGEPLGLLAAETAPRVRTAAARQEGLRILADAATMGLMNAAQETLGALRAR